MQFTVRLDDTRDKETIDLMEQVIEKSSFQGYGSLTAEVLRVALPALSQSPAFNRDVARVQLGAEAEAPQQPDFDIPRYPAGEPPDLEL